MTNEIKWMVNPLRRIELRVMRTGCLRTVIHRFVAYLLQLFSLFITLEMVIICD